MELVTTFAEARKLAVGRVGLVPTMGYLHEGHLSHVAAGRAQCDTVILSLFVNPLQFAPDEDLAGYPRDLARDAILAADAGVDALFAPSSTEMYPDEPMTRVAVAGLGDRLEGRSRQGHFSGVATVVAKLFAGLQPDAAFFGRKDAQQLAVITRMAHDLSFPVEVVGGPTVRESDGLALSSRNIYLSQEERSLVPAISRGLMRAASVAEEGERSGATLVAIVRAEVEPRLEPEYVELADRETIETMTRLDRDAFLSLAVRVGATRLIDNVFFDLSPDGSVVADRGVVLDGPSLLDSPEPGRG